MIYYGRDKTEEEFNRSCFMLTTIHPAGLGVAFALAGFYLFHLAAWLCFVGGLVIGGIVAILNRRNVARFRRLRALYQRGVLK